MKPFYINEYQGNEEMISIIDDRTEINKTGKISAQFVMREHERKMRIVCEM